MAISDGFIAQVTEVLRPLGTITVRRMFGGAGVYCDGVIIALVNDDVLYLKTDDTTRPAFNAEGTGPFRYATKDGEHTLTSYWRAPERLFDDEDEMLVWAKRALGVSRAVGDAKTKTAKKSAPSRHRAPNAERSAKRR